MNYYSEFDPFAAAWLRNLIEDGLIPEGDVDDRDIRDVDPKDLKGYTQCHFFAGIGGWSLALELAGWPTTRSVWTGSPPCQPFSTAGKQLGQEDERHLWPTFFNLISECQPPTLFGEQVATAIGHGWLDDLCHDLEAEGYAAGAVVLPACSVGAFHKRERIFFVGDAQRPRLEGHQRHEHQVDQPGWVKTKPGRSTAEAGIQSVTCLDGKRRFIPVEPNVQFVVNGVRPSMVSLWGGSFNSTIEKVNAYAEETKRSSGEVLQEVRTAISTQEIRREVGRLFGIYAEKVLLAALFELERQVGGEQKDVLQGIFEESKVQMRTLWGYPGESTALARTSSEFQLDGQQRGKLNDIVCELSHEASQRGDAVATVISLAGYPMSPSIPNHMGLIRGAGNAIVPQVAAEVIRAYMGT